MRFAEPWALLLVVLAPLSFLVFLALERRKTRMLTAAGDLDLLADLAHLGEDRGRTARLAQALLFSAGLGLVAIALARPQYGLRTEVRKGRGMDVVIALDLSKSMLAQDVVPSRLERARIEIADLIGRLGGDRVGLVGFTSVAVPLCPLTTDHSALLIQLRGATPEDFPRGGTAVGDAIDAAKEMLASSPYAESGKSIVLITDGEEHEGDAEGAARKAAEAGIEVHVIGVGSKTGEPIPTVDEQGRSKGYLKDKNGQTVISRLDEALIERTASAGGGIAALPTGQGGIELSKVAAHLTQQKRSELQNRTIRVYEERYRWALIPAFLLLVLATAVRPNRQLTRFAVMLLLCMLPLRSFAGPLDKVQPDVQAGNNALQEGKAADAIAAYDRARAAVGDDPRLAFNKGLAEVAAGELDQAIAEYQAAQKSTDPKVRADAAFALGNAQRALKKYAEAVTAYKEALIDDPSHGGAKRNLELVRAMERIQRLNPSQNQSPPKPDKKPPKDQDAGSGSDAHGGSDGNTPDAKGEDDQSGDDQKDGGGKQDESKKDGGDSSDGGQGGQGQENGDAGPKDTGSDPESNPSGEEQPLDKKQLDQLLDALGDKEKAAKRKKIQRMKPGKPEKDW
ncbi:MAG: VWA domain-containing protein [Deltaproteobacteria bacterium]|nr:VWA domain-containing protein [Deltaproteobacteria bacterium]